MPSGESIGTFVGFLLGLVAAFLITSYDAYEFLRDGYWDTMSVADLLVLLGDSAMPRSNPHASDWPGAVRILNWFLYDVPVSIVVILFGWFAGFAIDE